MIIPCDQFITNLEHPATKFDYNDPCIKCGYRLRDHKIKTK